MIEFELKNPHWFKTENAYDYRITMVKHVAESKMVYKLAFVYLKPFRHTRLEEMWYLVSAWFLDKALLQL